MSPKDMPRNRKFQPRRREAARAPSRTARLDPGARQRLLPRPARHRRKTHLAIALALKACERGCRVAFSTAQEWVSRLQQAQDRNHLEQELRRVERYQMLVVDEVGHLPLERQAANLLFALVSRRYERGSIIITSNRGFEPWARSSATP